MYDVARHAVAVRHTDDVGVAKPLRYAPERSCNRVMQQCGNNIQSYILHVLNATYTHKEVEGKFDSRADTSEALHCHLLRLGVCCAHLPHIQHAKSTIFYTQVDTCSVYKGKRRERRRPLGVRS